MLKTVGYPALRSGDQTIINGNLVIGTAGYGIDFSADPSAAGMTSELLDDYEEGTWTPVLTCITPGDLSVTYSAQTGFYTKVGRIVMASFFIATSAFTRSTASGVVRITGIPFATNASANSGSFGALAGQGIGKTSYTQIICSAASNSNFLVLPMSGPATNQNFYNCEIVDMPSGGAVILRGAVTYAT
jgi:hypothetical protein